MEKMDEAVAEGSGKIVGNKQTTYLQPRHIHCVLNVSLLAVYPSGVIIPPPDIRSVVDKTAQFVARNGKSFESRILNSSEGKTSKFNFMKQYDPYHAYYELKIRYRNFSKSIQASAPIFSVFLLKKQQRRRDWS